MDNIARRMQYRNYEIPWGSEKRELGILGEVHVYTKEESDFARDVVAEHDVVVAELGHTEKLLGCGLAMMLPVSAIYLVMNGRSFKNETARDWADLLSKPVVPLEDGYRMQYHKQAAMAGMGCLAWLMAPLVAKHYLSSHADRTEQRSDAAAKAVRYSADLEYRDQVMAYNLAKEIHKGPRKVLAVCGVAHLEGIVKNLEKEQKIPLQELTRKVL